jgi:hypothetical protein
MDNGYYNSDSPNVTVKVHMHQFAFENMPAKKSAKVNVLKKRKSPPRGEAPTSDEDIDVCTAINNNKANADEEVTKSNDDSALNQSGLNPAGVRKEDQFQDRTQRSREGNLNAIIPEPDTDEYLVEADDKVKHVYQGHLHSCQHADDCSDEAHSSGEEEPVDEWVKESDDEEEIISENPDNSQESELFENEQDLFCDICGESRAFDDFSEEQRMDVPPLPDWVHPEWTDIEDGDFRFCLRHSSEEQKNWILQWRSELRNARNSSPSLLSTNIAISPSTR